MNAYYRYWGKARPNPRLAGPDYHLLCYHSLDVASVGYVLLDPSKPLCRSIANDLGVDPGWLRAQFTFCLMLHDLGKFFRAFQNLAPDLSENLVPCDSQFNYDIRHDTLGFVLWQKALSHKLGFSADVSQALIGWLEVVCGHHGQPPGRRVVLKRHLLPEDESAAEEFVKKVVELWCPDLEPLVMIDRNVFKTVSWRLAGVAVLADWLGSDQQEFPYRADVTSLQDYWKKDALPGASRVLESSGITEGLTSEFHSIQQQFPFIQFPTPLQRYVQEIPLTSSAHLFILEDVTGAGKTEAAMVLVHRLMSAGLASGVYVGLPTMATSNAMYRRMRESYRSLYRDGYTPSLVLAHGARELSEDFMQSVTLTQQTPDMSYGNQDTSASAYCNQWLADNRKKALLADVGVGTIDQALLGILPARHQSLRLLGLMNKVLLVDEVHAFDPYMRSLLSVLIRAHAAQGGSSILLSATLPQNFRQQLIKAFAEGVNVQGPEIDRAAEYPWVTQMSASAFSEQKVATRKTVQRRVQVERLENEDATLSIVTRAVKDGYCVCWIRNTVADARRAFQSLLDEGTVSPDNISLFHSRYAMVDRQEVEKQTLAWFGKSSTGAVRAGRVLIATQVVEQSLDLDFDVMISDLAPIDLLIQRAGRLQRHIRGMDGEVVDAEEAQDSRPQACLFVVSPDPRKVENENWLKNVLAGTQAVYGNVGQLWLTMSLLAEKGGFEMPHDARDLIEGVYGDESQAEIPEVLEDSSIEAEVGGQVQASQGKFNCLRIERGYCLASARENGGWDEDVRIPTRLGGDTVTVALLIRQGDQWLPYAQGVRNAWALSQLSLPRREWERASEMIPAAWRGSLEQLKEQEPALRWVELMPLVEETSHLYNAVGGWSAP